MTDEEIIGCSKLGEEFCSYYEMSARALAIEVLALRREVKRLQKGNREQAEVQNELRETLLSQRDEAEARRKRDTEHLRALLSDAISAIDCGDAERAARRQAAGLPPIDHVENK